MEILHIKNDIAQHTESLENPKFECSYKYWLQISLRQTIRKKCLVPFSLKNNNINISSATNLPSSLRVRANEVFMLFFNALYFLNAYMFILCLKDAFILDNEFKVSRGNSSIRY